MIPRRLPSLEELELGTLNFPCDTLGGDLFDIIRISDEVLVFLLIDVADTGMRSTLISAMAKNCFINHIRQGISPFAVIERVNKELFRDIAIDLHLTAFLGYLDLHDNELTYCNTGHAGLVIYRREEKTIETLYCHETGIGIRDEGTFGEERTHLGQGDCLVLFTDGFYCLFDGCGSDRRTRTRANEFIRQELLDAPAAAMMKRIEERYAALTSDRPVEDDISIIYVEMLTRSRKNRMKAELGFGVDEVVYLQFLNYLEEMDRTVAVILSAMDVAGYPDDVIRKMKIVLTELLVNAITHGNKKNCSKRVVVGHIIDRTKATVAIMDEGTGFDPSVIPDPTLPENLEKPCGRGLFIVRHYVESITFNETGNRVTIVKNNNLT